ncbi:MAG: RAD55 family ATPase [Candidatus Nezhaarchaeales archaeon]
MGVGKPLTRETLVTMIRVVVVAVSVNVLLSLVPFYPPFTIIAAIIVLALTAYKWPGVSLAVGLLLVIPAAAYQDAYLGLFSLQLAFVLAILSLTKWQLTGFALLSLALAWLPLSRSLTFTPILLAGLLFGPTLGGGVGCLSSALQILVASGLGLESFGMVYAPRSTYTLINLSKPPLQTLTVEAFTQALKGVLTVESEGFSKLLTSFLRVYTENAVTALQVVAWGVAGYLMAKAALKLRENPALSLTGLLVSLCLMLAPLAPINALDLGLATPAFTALTVSWLTAYWWLRVKGVQPEARILTPPSKTILLPEFKPPPGEVKPRKAGPAKKVLSELISGGVPDSMVIMVLGDPGSGKTTLCESIIREKLEEGKRCVYIAYDEAPSRIRKRLKGFGLDVEPYEESGALVFIDCYSTSAGIPSAEKFYVTTPSDLTSLNLEASSLIDKVGVAPIVFLDSLTALLDQVSPKSLLEFVHTLGGRVEAKGGLLLLTLSTGTLPGEELLKLETMVDGVIEIEMRELEGSLTRRLRVKKMRGVIHVDKWARFELLGSGVVIHPEP